MRAALVRNTLGHVLLLRKNQNEKQKLGRKSESFISEVLELASPKIQWESQVRCDAVKISNMCCSLFRRYESALWGGIVRDGINRCGWKSNSWQFSSSGPPSAKLQIIREIPLTPAPANSSAKSPDSPPQHRFNSWMLTRVSKFPHQIFRTSWFRAELYTLLHFFPHLNQQIIACVQLGNSLPKWGGTRSFYRKVQLQREMAQERSRQGKTNAFTVNEHRIYKPCLGVWNLQNSVKIIRFPNTSVSFCCHTLVETEAGVIVQW